MKFADHLSKEQIRLLNQPPTKNKKKRNPKKSKKKKQEKLSEHDLRELMGTNRDTYKRVRGAVRRE